MLQWAGLSAARCLYPFCGLWKLHDGTTAVKASSHFWCICSLSFAARREDYVAQTDCSSDFCVSATEQREGATLLGENMLHIMAMFAFHTNFNPPSRIRAVLFTLGTEGNMWPGMKASHQQALQKKPLLQAIYVVWSVCISLPSLTSMRCKKLHKMKKRKLQFLWTQNNSPCRRSTRPQNRSNCF